MYEAEIQRDLIAPDPTEAAQRARQQRPPRSAYAASGAAAPDLPSGSDHWTRAIGRLEAELRQLLTQFEGEDGFRSDRLFLVATDDQVCSATARGFSDGSVLISVSDALLSRVVTLCQNQVLVLNELGLMKPGLGRPFGIVRFSAASQKKRDSYHRALGVHLRFNIRRQQFWGTHVYSWDHPPNKLVEEWIQSLFSTTLGFILCHEFAHCALGHLESAATGSARRAEEIEADEFAVPLVYSLAKTWGAAGETHAAMSAWFGMSLGIYALHMDEKSRFIRTARTHPYAQERLARAPEMYRKMLVYLDGALKSALGDDQYEGYLWESVGEGLSEVDGYLDAWYLQSLEHHGARLANTADQWPVMTFAQAFGDRSAAGALSAIGVNGHAIARICDPSTSLTLNGLYRAIERAFEGVLPREATRWTAISATRMCEELLRIEERASRAAN